MDKNLKMKIAVVLGITVVFTAALAFLELSDSRIRKIQRNDYGGGSKRGQYEVTVGKKLKKETVDVEISERKYTKREVRSLFKETMDQLEKTVLGKNKSVNHVEYDLNLITKMPDIPLEILWESDRTDIVNSVGEIQEENLSEKGELVELKAYLTYGEEESLYILNVMVYPKTLNATEQLLNGVKDLVKKADEESIEQSAVRLPERIGEEQIVWRKKPEHRAVYIAFLGGILAVLLYVQERQNQEKAQKEKEQQMQRDYPEIVSQIALLVGTGITVKNAWKKIASNYQENRAVKGGMRYAYEEMMYTMREMQGGVSEAESYEHFGKRCGIPKYRKLGMLLSQNIRKGTKGIIKILDVESGEALEEKRQMAKRRGEETSTKLLLPMSLMLVVVLVIVIVPAFMSISL